ncbi:DinB family protein [Saccharopolyspora rhizosphaerae]|uniref:DinB family protein n=1 Tax=Saccharopolyspora rhizosphaerae TaxID=2492662 RepID=A0A426JQR7_9PSEU|nr:DinB family protein [Saccharopolyspora rhizosphaerae]RRO15505.1 DinB family protein [Saccharopolyspora rhizosphaerae]
MTDEKAVLQLYLDQGRDAVLWKVEGLSEYDLRRPMTPTGTNLLGLVKHLATVELGYFGDVFGRPSGIPMPWTGPGAELDADMWARPDESRDWVLDLYRRARGHADETIDALELDSRGAVPWWPTGEVTLHRILVHVIQETGRHAGHVDILRELIDGSVGRGPDNDNMASHDESWWREHRERLERVAREAAR